LREYPDYYDRLATMEREAEAAWALNEHANLGNL
jgi:hypothetical protein